MTKAKPANQDEDIGAAFHHLVNMPPAKLTAWLDTEESRSVGITHEGDTESVGHASGHLIVAIKHKKKADLTDSDMAHMHKVVSYIRRHLAQGGPEADRETSRAGATRS